MSSEVRTPSVAVIGAGFGGLGMAIRLKQAGFGDLTVFEQGDDVGGVWRANTYPGAACDVPSHLYSFSFAPNTDWSRKFAGQEEIHSYLRGCAERFGLLRHIRFGTAVRAARFDETLERWVLTLGDGSIHETDILISACGQLSRPSIPPIPGLDTFAGTTFHSAQWRQDHDLSGRSVAVVGTGASAIQFVPHVAARAGRMSLFQVDAPHIVAKPDRPYGRLSTAAFRRIPGLLRFSRWAQYWQYESRALAFTRFPGVMGLVDKQAKRHLRRQVPDPALRRKLEPQGAPGCKRILLSNDYYPSLTRDNVDVVTDRITEIRPHGLVTADGTEHPADTIIFGTGFAATDFLAPMTVTGPADRDLHRTWRDGAEAYLGIAVAGFPNLFLLYGPNTNLGHSSIVFMLESQINYVLRCVRLLASGRARTMDVRPDAQNRFNRWVQDRIKATVWDRGCTSWYRTASGKNTNNWPGFTFAYRARTRGVDPADYEMKPAAAPAAITASGAEG